MSRGACPALRSQHSTDPSTDPSTAAKPQGTNYLKARTPGTAPCLTFTTSVVLTFIPPFTVLDRLTFESTLRYGTYETNRKEVYTRRIPHTALGEACEKVATNSDRGESLQEAPGSRCQSSQVRCNGPGKLYFNHSWVLASTLSSCCLAAEKSGSTRRAQSFCSREHLFSGWCGRSPSVSTQSFAGKSELLRPFRKQLKLTS